MEVLSICLCVFRCELFQSTGFVWLQRFCQPIARTKTKALDGTGSLAPGAPFDRRLLLPHHSYYTATYTCHVHSTCAHVYVLVSGVMGARYFGCVRVQVPPVLPPLDPGGAPDVQWAACGPLLLMMLGQQNESCDRPLPPRAACVGGRRPVLLRA